MKPLIIILGIIILISPIFLLVIGSDSQQVIAPCVDGDGDINLEGIMCDKKVPTLFGDDDPHSLLFVPLYILVVIGTVISFGGVHWD